MSLFYIRTGRNVFKTYIQTLLIVFLYDLSYDGCMKRRTLIHLGLLALVGCAVPPTARPTSDGTFQGTPTRRPTQPGIPRGECHPAVWPAPTKPALLPSVDELDDVGLHVVNAGRAPTLDAQTYRLKVGGRVENPLELSLDDLRCLPKMTETVNLTCKGYFEDVTTYTGVPLQHILQLARMEDGVSGLNLIGAEGYPGHVSLLEALRAENFLAYQWKEQPLPILHGFPVRAVLPALLGYAWTKFLVEIIVE